MTTSKPVRANHSPLPPASAGPPGGLAEQRMSQQSGERES
jgi:hypothetical protein